MRISISRLRVRHHILALLFPKPLETPVFLLGCGRSGTTILGKSLGKHPQITYLNERRDLWEAFYPESIIWGQKAVKYRGKLALNAVDTNEASNRKLRAIFRMEALLQGKPIVVEKLPINNFRLPFLHAIFPKARFLHIVRHGVEVARSIAKRADMGGWFTENDYKWKLLVAYANADPTYASLPAHCQTNYERGLLEWRLSVDAVNRYKPFFSEDNFFEIEYRDFMDYPALTINKALAFLNLPESERVDEFVTNNVQRRTAPATNKDVGEVGWLLGGTLLERWGTPSFRKTS